jgi:hypothetical protein
MGSGVYRFEGSGIRDQRTVINLEFEEFERMIKA